MALSIMGIVCPVCPDNWHVRFGISRGCRQRRTRCTHIRSNGRSSLYLDLNMGCWREREMPRRHCETSARHSQRVSRWTLLESVWRRIEALEQVWLDSINGAATSSAGACAFLGVYSNTQLCLALIRWPVAIYTSRCSSDCAYQRVHGISMGWPTTRPLPHLCVARGAPPSRPDLRNQAGLAFCTLLSVRAFAYLRSSCHL